MPKPRPKKSTRRKAKAEAIRETCTYQVGPYQGYYGAAEYDAAEGTFQGRVLGTKDIITFEADSIRGAKAAFTESIDDYLSFCAGRNETPDKPYSGKFVARLDPELHRVLSVLAEARGQSLNRLVTETLERAAKEAATAQGQAPTRRVKRSSTDVQKAG